jgi:hypothetical protein
LSEIFLHQAVKCLCGVFGKALGSNLGWFRRSLVRIQPFPNLFFFGNLDISTA